MEPGIDIEAGLPPRGAVDAFIDAIPDDVYQPCPCGCGKKWRYVVKESQDKPFSLNEHEWRFIEKWTKEHSHEASEQR